LLSVAVMMVQEKSATEAWFSAASSNNIQVERVDVQAG
jgi:hypothetical protein